MMSTSPVRAKYISAGLTPRQTPNDFQALKGRNTPTGGVTPRTRRTNAPSQYPARSRRWGRPNKERRSKTAFRITK